MVEPGRFHCRSSPGKSPSGTYTSPRLPCGVGVDDADVVDDEAVSELDDDVEASVELVEFPNGTELDADDVVVLVLQFP